MAAAFCCQKATTPGSRGSKVLKLPRSMGAAKFIEAPIWTPYGLMASAILFMPAMLVVLRMFESALTLFMTMALSPTEAMMRA